MKVPVRRERLTMERIVRAISLAVFLRTVVGMGSKLQCEVIGKINLKFSIGWQG